jgi:hypothetical protein
VVLNPMAVDGPTNQGKGDGDAATWLPPNKACRCAYVRLAVGGHLGHRPPLEHPLLAAAGHS